MTFVAGEYQVHPDCFFRLAIGGRAFDLAFEIDSSTEPIVTQAASSMRHKYQDMAKKITPAASEQPG